MKDDEDDDDENKINHHKNRKQSPEITTRIHADHQIKINNHSSKGFINYSDSLQQSTAVIYDSTADTAVPIENSTTIKNSLLIPPNSMSRNGGVTAAANDDNNMVLLNIFLINKKRYRVLFHSGVLVWEPADEHSKKTTDKKSVSICDIITIKLQQKDAGCCQPPPIQKLRQQPLIKKTQQKSTAQQSNNNNKDGNEKVQVNHEEINDDDYERLRTIPLANHVIIESCAVQQQQQQNSSSSSSFQLQATSASKHFIIYYGRRRTTTNQESDKWSVRHVTMENTDCRIIHLWFQTIGNALNEQTFRPKRILMFINPFGGKQRALQIYEKYGKPIFKLANVDVNVVISQRPNQIRDIILTQSLAHFDGIACVGGDGTFSEVFNGLIYRTIGDLGLDPLRPEYIPKPTLPIGIIPGGSTDTVAYCIHGTIDIPTCVLHIVFGQRRGLDLASVSNKNGLLRLYASVMSYGYLGDIALDSEKFRWMGPKRYDYSGIKKFFANKGYEGELSILLNDDDGDDDDENSSAVDELGGGGEGGAGEGADDDKIEPQKCKNEEKNPNIGPGCYENCERCFSATQKFHLKKAVINFDDIKKSIIGTNKIDNCCDDDAAAAATAAPPPQIMNKSMKWKIIRGKFFMVNGANLSCACARSPNGFSKYCHIGDGCVDLVLIRHTNLINNLKLLLAMSSKNSQISELPFVEIYRTRTFHFRNCTKNNNNQSRRAKQENTIDDRSSIPSNALTVDPVHYEEEDIDQQNQYEFNSSTQPITDNIGNCYLHQNRNHHQDPQRDHVTTASSNWNCDGEVIQDSDIVVRSHCQLVDVYMRGRYQRDITSDNRKKLTTSPPIITTGIVSSGGGGNSRSCRNQIVSSSSTTRVIEGGNNNNNNHAIDEINPPQKDCKSFLTCGML